MAAFDTDPPPRVEALRAVLPRLAASRRVAQGGADARAELRSWLSRATTRTLMALRGGASVHAAVGQARDDLSSACAIARARGICAEHVIVLLKEAWRVVPGLHPVTRAEDDLVLARVVTLCILTYYASE